MRPLMRFFDWRFLLALTVLVLIGSVCWTTVAQARDNEAKAKQIDHLISAIADEQASSARQRERLLDGQRRLESKYDELAEANQQMADLLTARGIPLPSSVTRIQRSSDDDGDDDDGDDSDTIIVRPPTSNPTPRPTTPSNDDDDDNGETVPDVDDLTDMADDIVDDLLKTVPTR
jgi:hypothetical protein